MTLPPTPCGRFGWLCMTLTKVVKSDSWEGLVVAELTEFPVSLDDLLVEVVPFNSSSSASGVEEDGGEGTDTGMDRAVLTTEVAPVPVPPPVKSEVLLAEVWPTVSLTRVTCSLDSSVVLAIDGGSDTPVTDNSFPFPGFICCCCCEAETGGKFVLSFPPSILSETRDASPAAGTTGLWATGLATELLLGPVISSSKGGDLGASCPESGAVDNLRGATWGVGVEGVELEFEGGFEGGLEVTVEVFVEAGGWGGGS